MEDNANFYAYFQIGLLLLSVPLAVCMFQRKQTMGSIIGAVGVAIVVWAAASLPALHGCGLGSSPWIPPAAAFGSGLAILAFESAMRGLLVAAVIASASVHVHAKYVDLIHGNDTAATNGWVFTDESYGLGADGRASAEACLSAMNETGWRRDRDGVVRPEECAGMPFYQTDAGRFWHTGFTGLAPIDTRAFTVEETDGGQLVVVVRRGAPF